MNKAVNIINGENNIIIVVKKNIEYINNYSKIPLGFKINISGSNNVIKLCLPIKTKDFNINICDREKGVKNYNDNYIEIGSILVWGSVNIACQGSKNKITIGKGTRINTKLSIKTERATLSIGEDCLISDADFWVTDYHDVIDAEGNKINKQKHPCIIGKHCWLGANTTFLKNAQIAENCIVGVGAVVGKVFSESNCCICGNPANIVKRGVNWK
ncbi:MAG: hypothetical protein LBT02_02490 [Rickettsiales bacterium]|jgi:acetyltransferase-like isoleucine patch superfamily enzyme|nr:hypothetical protein [Rickettsiales bacterium]